jgi:hypothetical protein
MDASREDVHEGERVRVYEGFLTKLIASLRMPNPYYTFVTNALQEMDCIQQLRRGGGSSPSLWWLKQPPTPEMYAEKGGGTSYAKRHDRYAMLEQQIRALNTRILKLEEIVNA